MSAVTNTHCPAVAKVNHCTFGKGVHQDYDSLTGLTNACSFFLSQSSHMHCKCT